MHRLVTIDLSQADLAAFDAYEAVVLSLLPKVGGRLEARMRAVDGSSETHLLYFPDARALEAFLGDPVRLAAREAWDRIGAVSSVTEVNLLACPAG